MYSINYNRVTLDKCLQKKKTTFLLELSQLTAGFLKISFFVLLILHYIAKLKEIE